MPAQSQMYITIGLGGIVLILLIWNIGLQIGLSRLKKKQNVLFTGKSAQSLEEIILKNNLKMQNLDKDIKDLYDITARIHALAHRGIHKVSMLRFNPFKDIGGDQSFSLALMDGNLNGVVISSLYNRDGVRVYAKALKRGHSEKYPLTEEEKHAIALAANVGPQKQKQGA